MRNSTNIFLVNLSVADLCVLLICTPTVLVEVNSGPEIWLLGEHMCKSSRSILPYIARKLLLHAAMHIWFSHTCANGRTFVKNKQRNVFFLIFVFCYFWHSPSTEIDDIDRLKCLNQLSCMFNRWYCSFFSMKLVERMDDFFLFIVQSIFIRRLFFCAKLERTVQFLEAVFVYYSKVQPSMGHYVKILQWN